MSGEPSTYVQGMVVFHTLRALRDWIRSIEQTLLHRMNIRAGSAAVAAPAAGESFSGKFGGAVKWPVVC